MHSNNGKINLMALSPIQLPQRSIIIINNLFNAIGKYCTNIVSLKYTCFFYQKKKFTCFEKDESKALVKHTPNLIKVLSIRNMIVNRIGVLHVLDSLEHLWRWLSYATVL
jgi:hypothetical protein